MNTAELEREVFKLRQVVDAILSERSGATRQGASSLVVPQAAHGFAVGNPIRLTVSGWVKSKADTAANAVVNAVVALVLSPDAFLAILPGSLIVGLSGLTAGSRYYLDATTAGAVTTTPPTIASPVYDAVSTTAAILCPFGASASMLAVSGNGTPTQLTSTTWNGGTKLVLLAVIGGGGGGGGGIGSGFSATPNWLATGGGGSTGGVQILPFIFYDGDVITVSNGAGGGGGTSNNTSVPSYGSNGGTTTITVVRSSVTVLSVTASAGLGGQSAYGGVVVAPGVGGTSTGGGTPGRDGIIAAYSTGFSSAYTVPSAAYVGLWNTTVGRGGQAGGAVSNGSAGLAGGVLYI